MVGKCLIECMDEFWPMDNCINYCKYGEGGDKSCLFPHREGSMAGRWRHCSLVVKVPAGSIPTCFGWLFVPWTRHVTQYVPQVHTLSDVRECPRLFEKSRGILPPYRWPSVRICHGLWPEWGARGRFKEKALLAAYTVGARQWRKICILVDSK